MNNTEQTSQFLFLLRTNVGHFDGPRQVVPFVEKVKQASLLYDNLVFEDGVYEAIVAEDGMFGFHQIVEEDDDSIPDVLSDELQISGGQAFFAVAAEGSEEHHLIIKGKILRRYRSTFIPLLRSMQANELPWIEVRDFEFTNRGTRAAKKFAAAFHEDFDRVFPVANTRLRQQLLANLGRDIVVSLHLSSPMSLDGIYASFLERQLFPAPGHTALQLLLPDLSGVSWEHIVKLREHDSIIELRSKLHEWEELAQKAVVAGEFESAQYQSQVARSIISSLLQELIAQMPKASSSALNVGVELLIGATPVGPLLSALREFGRFDSADRSWLSALYRLSSPHP